MTDTTQILVTVIGSITSVVIALIKRPNAPRGERGEKGEPDKRNKPKFSSSWLALGLAITALAVALVSGKAVADAPIPSAPVPRGTIVAWYAKGGPVPAGWALCDGNDDRPNLQDRFLRGTLLFKDVGATGGQESHQHRVYQDKGDRNGDGFQNDGQLGLGHTDKASNLPPFFTVVYIIKL